MYLDAALQNLQVSQFDDIAVTVNKEYVHVPYGVDKQRFPAPNQWAEQSSAQRFK